MKLTIGLPSGIGDASWALSKLYAVRDQIREIRIADGWPLRTIPYVHLFWSPEERAARPVVETPDDPREKLPGTSYGNFTYQTIRQFEAVNEIAYAPGYSPTWADVLSKVGGYGQILLQPNNHLEAGLPLASWLADLPTEYHYPLYVDPADLQSAQQMLARLLTTKPLVGVSCASYRGAEGWKTWGRAQWTLLLQNIIRHGWQPVLLGGSWDDLTSGVAAALNLPDLVGRTNVPEMVGLLTHLDAYLGFSSGLGVVRTVLNKPALSLWPDFQKELSTSWAPPDMLSAGRYVACPYRDPVLDTWPVVKRFLNLCEEEKRDGERQAQRQAQEAEVQTGQAGILRGYSVGMGTWPASKVS